MTLRSVRVGRLAGIPIGIQPLWLAIVGLITWSLGHDYFPAQIDDISPGMAYALGLAGALLLFRASCCTSSATPSSLAGVASRSRRSTSGCWAASRA